MPDTDLPTNDDADYALPASYVTVPIDSVQPHPRNYNSHDEGQIQDLAKSALQFGQTKNIVVWNGLIIAGNGFYMGAKLANLSHIDIKDVSHWPEARALAYMTVDNEIARKSSADPFGLADLVREAHTLGEDTPGISEQDLLELMARANMAGGTDFPPENSSGSEDEPTRSYKISLRVIDTDQFEAVAAGVRELIAERGWNVALEV